VCGPVCVTRSVRAPHLKITPKEWEAFLNDFKQTLGKFKVPAKEQNELRAVVDSTRSDIMVEAASA